MDYERNFEIENGILKSYTGPGGDLVIPEGVKHISDYTGTFPDDVEFTSVFLPNSLELSPWRMWFWPHYLKTKAYLVSPDHPVLACFDGAVYNKDMTELLAYPLLKQGELALPDTMQHIGFHTLTKAQGLTAFRVGPESAALCALDGVLFSKDKKQLLFCPYGKAETVTIPPETAAIFDEALENCPLVTRFEVSAKNQKFQSIDGVLYNKTGSRLLKVPAAVTSLTIPNTAQVAVQDGAFKDAVNLKTLVMPARAYTERLELSPTLEYIELTGSAGYHSHDGVVLRRNRDGQSSLIFCPQGRETAYTVPDCVTELSDAPFAGCRKLPEIHFAGKIPKMGQTVFSDCGALRIPSQYLRIAEKVPAAFATQAKTFDQTDLQWLAIHQTAKIWKETVETQVLPLNKADFFQGMLELLADLNKLPKATGMNALEFVQRWSPELRPEQIRSLREILVSKKCTAPAAALDADPRLQAALSGEAAGQEQGEIHPIEQLVRENWVNSKLFRDMQQRIKKGIAYRDSDRICHPDVLVFVVASYAQQLDENVRFYSMYKTEYVRAAKQPMADQVAEALDPDALRDFLEELSVGSNPDEGYIPSLDGSVLALGRFGTPAQISKLITGMRKWEKCGPAGRKSIIIARGGLMLSDTREAILALDKTGVLDYYAKLRGTTAEDLRDNVLADFGLDENGKKIFDLGNGRGVEIRLNADLSLGIWDLAANKPAKSIPKKGADPQFHAEASAAFSDMKKNVKKIAKSRNDALFQAFLEESLFDAAAWKKSYLHNPLLRQVASLLVWEQKGITFTLRNQEIISHDESTVALTNAPIRLAHPMQMDASLVTLWQKYFTRKGLKQMFRQIWEPVFDPASINPDRYCGCTVPVLTLAGQKKHGIGVDNLAAYSDSFSLWLTHCAIEAEPSDWRYVPGMNDDLYYTLGNFTFRIYTRWTNHIVAWFDRYLIADKIKKDDISVANLLPGFTLAQITEFIQLAAEHHSTNVTAILLDYQNKNFSDFDPMEAFSLEW